MGKNAYFFITALVAIAIVIAAAFILVNTDFSPYEYSVERDGVLFVSNSAEPSEIISDALERELFIVSPRFSESGAENAYMTTVFTSFSTVLKHEGKEVILVGRLYDGEGGLVECQSNMGDSKTNETLFPSECNELLNDSGGVRIFVEFPDNKSTKSIALLERGKITVTPASFEDVPEVNFAVLKALFPNAEQIIEQANLILGSL